MSVRRTPRRYPVRPTGAGGHDSADGRAAGEPDQRRAAALAPRVLRRGSVPLPRPAPPAEPALARRAGTVLVSIRVFAATFGATLAVALLLAHSGRLPAGGLQLDRPHRPTGSPEPTQPVGDDAVAATGTAGPTSSHTGDPARAVPTLSPAPPTRPVAAPSTAPTASSGPTASGPGPTRPTASASSGPSSGTATGPTTQTTASASDTETPAQTGTPTPIESTGPEPSQTGSSDPDPSGTP